MRSFSQINEATGVVVFTFGRFNPPTTGHEKLILKVAKVAGSNPFRIYPSQSQNPKKDPLPYALKVAYMKKMFPRYARNIVADKTAKTAIDIAVKLFDEGYTELVMVAGSDRVKEFQKLLTTYNGAEGKRHGYYKFNSVNVISAGERDPDAEGVEGMSASKMRTAASNGDFDSFAKGLPSSFKDGKQLYNDVRKNMGIREEKDMGVMNDLETLRDLYLTGKIWNINDIVEANGVEGKIIRKGTNYVAFNDKDGKVHKAWLHEITLDERNYASEYKNYHSRPEQIERRSSRNKARRVMGDNVVKGMDVGHKDNNPMNNNPDNLRNEDPSDNRREPRLRDEKYDSDKFFSGKGTPEQRLQLLKLQNKALRAPGGSPKQNAIRKEIDALRKKMGMKVTKEEVELNELPSYSPAFVRKLLGKVDQITHPKGYESIVKRYVDAMKKDKNTGRAMQTAIGGISNAPSLRSLQTYINKLVTKGTLPQELKAEFEIDERNTKQDPDIKDRKGTQPAKYYAKDTEGDAMAPSTKKKRAAHFAKKKSGPAPGDASATTKPSQHTKKFKQMYGEDMELNEKIAGLVTKAKKSGMPYGILKKVYDRGMAAYKTGHRPGTTAQQWAFARVNSFTTKSSGTWGKADKDLADKVRKSEEVELDEVKSKKYVVNFKSGLGGRKASKTVLAKNEDDAESIVINKYNLNQDQILSVHLASKKEEVEVFASGESVKEWFESNYTRERYEDTYGEDWWWKLNEMHDAMLEKIGADCCDDCEEVDESLWANIHKKRQRIKQGSGEKMRKKGAKGAPTPAQLQRAKGEEVEERRTLKFNELERLNNWGEVTEDAEYQGRKVKLNNPMKGDVKKTKVYVKNDKGNVVKVEFGDPNMSIKRDDPERRKSFRARHNCDNPGPKYKARYWSCKFWSSKSVTDLMKG